MTKFICSKMAEFVCSKNDLVQGWALSASVGSVGARGSERLKKKRGRAEADQRRGARDSTDGLARSLGWLMLFIT
jgi:hypothetical protein